MIRIIFSYLAKKAKAASGGNCALKCIVGCGECCLWCIEKIVDYINLSAYCYMAVSGEGFCESAWHGFLLQIKHTMEFGFAGTIARVFILLGKMCIVVVNCFTCLLIMHLDPTSASVHSIWGPILVVALWTFFAASIFLGTFSVTVLALMTCYGVDKDLNPDGVKWGPKTFHDSLNDGALGKKDNDYKKVDEKKSNDVS